MYRIKILHSLFQILQVLSLLLVKLHLQIIWNTETEKLEMSLKKMNKKEVCVCVCVCIYIYIYTGNLESLQNVVFFMNVYIYICVCTITPVC